MYFCENKKVSETSYKLLNFKIMHNKEKIKEIKDKKLIEKTNEYLFNQDSPFRNHEDKIEKLFEGKDNFLERIKAIKKFYGLRGMPNKVLPSLAKELKKFEKHKGNSNFFNDEVLKNPDSEKLFKVEKRREFALLSAYFCFLTDGNFPINNKRSRHTLEKVFRIETNRDNFFDKDKIDKINNLKIELDVSFKKLDAFLWSYARLDTDDIEKFIKFIMGSQYQDFFNENEEKLNNLMFSFQRI